MCVCACVCVCVCLRGIHVYIIVDLVKRGVLTFVGAIRRYGNDPLLLLSLLSPIVFISVKGAFHVVLQRSKIIIK